MRKLEAPTDDACDVYTLCISRVRKRALRVRLQRVLPDIRAAASALSAAGAGRTFYRIPIANNVGGIVSTQEMSAVYDSRMAKKGAPGRSIYDRLVSAAPHMRCPLCGQRMVSTLDHYMARAYFPALAVVPLNLVPACADCNKKKLAKVAGAANEQTLHPYFDDVDSDVWLRAEVIEGPSPVLRYFVDAPGDWPAVMRGRVQHHFSALELGALYASHSGEELMNIRHALTLLFERAGIEGVRAHLLSELESRTRIHINSWQAAMYRALSASDWYCGGGFLE
jgi:hypothetical protein